MLLMTCSLANHFISRKDVDTPFPASLSSITHLKLVVLPVICPYIQRSINFYLKKLRECLAVNHTQYTICQLRQMMNRYRCCLQLHRLRSCCQHHLLLCLLNYLRLQQMVLQQQIHRLLKVEVDLGLEQQP